MPGCPGLEASANISYRLACLPFFCGKLSEKNLSSATCLVHLGAGGSSRVPTQPKPVGAEDWTEGSFTA